MPLHGVGVIEKQDHAVEREGRMEGVCVPRKVNIASGEWDYGIERGGGCG